MKTKREALRAQFIESKQNAKNLSGEKALINRILVIDKKTERTIVDARIWMGTSRNASTVYASVWMNGVRGKKTENFHTCGYGTASGYGYHKQSAALQSAFTSAGVIFFGSPYNRVETVNINGETVEEKGWRNKRAYFGGCGDLAMTNACLAAAYALGCTDAILID